MTIHIEIDPARDLTPDEFETLKANARVAGRTVEQQLKALLLGPPGPLTDDARRRIEAAEVAA